MRKLAAFAAILIFPVLMLADQITLKDGNAFNGTFLGGTATNITFRDNNGVRHRFNVGDIQSLYFGTSYSGNRGSANRSVRDYDGPSTNTDRPYTNTDRPYANTDRPYTNTGRPYTNTGGTRILPSGTQIAVRTDEVIESRTATEGQTFSATIEQDVMDDAGNVAIPRRSTARLVIRDIRAGSTTGSPNLVLDLDSVTVNGQRYMVSTEDVTQSGQSGIGKNRRTAEMVGGGAALGTLLGAIAGGGKGAIIGAISGAAAGGAVQVLTKGKEVRVPAETMLTFRLDQPLRLRPV